MPSDVRKVWILKVYTVALLAFLAIDAVWLAVVARGFYSNHLGFLLSPTPNWHAAGVFYLLFVAGLAVFVILPGLEAESLKRVLLYGALYGLVTYSTYDLTNLATHAWPHLWVRSAISQADGCDETRIAGPGLSLSPRREYSACNHRASPQSRQRSWTWGTPPYPCAFGTPEPSCRCPRCPHAAFRGRVHAPTPRTLRPAQDRL